MVWRIVRATMVNIRGKVYRRLGSDETAPHTGRRRRNLRLSHPRAAIE